MVETERIFGSVFSSTMVESAHNYLRNNTRRQP